MPFVPETAFGIGFLRTRTWEHHVLRVAIDDLKGLIDTPLPMLPVLVDAGCGQGISFRLLADALKPRRLVGIDYHDMIRRGGFHCTEGNVSLPYLWWGRAKDFGLLERLGLCRPQAGERRERLVNVAALKAV
ncbi:class I SAM-dependent methyltransferase [Paraburkholderia sp. MPAMCS5]|uniref:class I SAM-dependent methyltransferase n=1 Tax=Paraburkholderia sp. MPAMCS5 TaxID=3112563 RepID=UPI002E18C726|nr:class I SAM-dependent methyltransferase [Paraburkholderia sp. MPAMCS5]